MTPFDLKPLALEAVKRAATRHQAVKFREVRAEIAEIGTTFFDDRGLDRALQTLRREKTIRYVTKRDPKTGKPRKRWGWRPVGKGSR